MQNQTFMAVNSVNISHADSSQTESGAGPSYPDGEMAKRVAASLPLHPTDKKGPSSDLKKRPFCLRCKKEPSTIVVQTSKFCTSCFQLYFEGKVRTGLEQARICAYIRRMEGEEDLKQEYHIDSQPDPTSSSKFGNARKTRSGRVLLGLSGGPNSRALLRMLKEHLLPPPGYDAKKGKPHEVFAVDVVYIDDCALQPSAESRTEEVRQIVEDEGGESVGLYFIPLRIEDVFEDGRATTCTAGFKQTRSISNSSTQISSLVALQNLFSTLRPEKVPRTALANARSRAEDMHRLLLIHLLRREAEKRQVSCLLTGENATRRAIRTIEGIGRGQGHKMPMEEGPIRFRDVYVLKPLSDVTSKEVTFYLRSNNIKSLIPDDLIVSELLADQDAGGSGNKASIGRLTESLINLLEGNVPGTISTVNRTSSKLVFRDEEATHVALNQEDDKDQRVDQIFEAVGPSMPLRRHKHPKNNNENGSSINELEQNVRGLGLGGQGAKVYLSVKSWPHFTGFHACPLCQMPAQRGLQEWRKALTVDKKEEEKEKEVKKEEWKEPFPINLSNLLCYACNLLLDTPETTSSDQTMPLPSFVLEDANKRIQEGNAVL